MANREFCTVLFDIDGVMLSEERYFDGSALTVYELLCSPQYLGLTHPLLPAFRTSFTNEEIAEVRRVTFASDAVFETVKTRGVNANWDMVYLQVAYHVAAALAHLKDCGQQGVVRDIASRSTEQGWTREVIVSLGQALKRHGQGFNLDFGAFCTDMQPCATKADLFGCLEDRLQQVAGAEVTPFETNRALWTLCQVTFQEWYLGDDYVTHTYQSGKSGFLADEVPLVEAASLKQLFQDIKTAGMTIGIATGRPELETTIPLQYFGWLEEFELERVSTASDVLVAEQSYPEKAPLAKPNPYSYLRSFLHSPEPGVVLTHALPLHPATGAETLIVGDSVADLLAARAMGCTFAAVLTGLEGERARAQFESRQADYILDDVLGVKSVLKI